MDPGWDRDVVLVGRQPGGGDRRRAAVRGRRRRRARVPLARRGARERRRVRERRGAGRRRAAAGDHGRVRAGGDRRRAAAQGAAADAAGHRRLDGAAAGREAGRRADRPWREGRPRTRASAPASRSRSCSTGASSPRSRSSAASPTRSSSSSAPTRASRSSVGGKEVECCSADWAALYANRARRMADTYRQGGNARVYWITIPTARDADRAKINRVVNAAVKVAAQPWATPGPHPRHGADVRPARL